jgi:hypothetical protein
MDSQFYGGQTRIDWLACDRVGRFWMVEVKQMSSGRRTINLRTDVSPGQRDALTHVSRTTVGISLLAVGQDDTLYIFDWGRVLWQWRERNDANLSTPEEWKGLPSLLPLADALLQIRWTGPKAWETVHLLSYVERLWAHGVEAVIEPMLITPERASRKRASSPSTLKPPVSTPTPARMLRLVR